MSTRESDFYFHPGILQTLQQNSEWWLPFSPRILELVACASSTPCPRTFSRVHPVVEHGTLLSSLTVTSWRLPCVLTVPDVLLPSPRWIPHDRLRLQGGLLYRLESGTTPLFTSSDTRTMLWFLDHCLGFWFHMKINYLFPNMVKRFTLKNIEWAYMIFSKIDRWWRRKCFPLYYNWSNTVYVQKASFILLVTTLWVLVGFSFFHLLFNFRVLEIPRRPICVWFLPLKLHGKSSFSFFWDGKIQKLYKI